MWGVLGPAAAGGFGGHQWHETAAGVKASERNAHIKGCLADGPHNWDRLAAEAAAAVHGVQCQVFPALVCLQPGGAGGQAVAVAVTESRWDTSDPLTARVCMASSIHTTMIVLAGWKHHYVMVLAARQHHSAQLVSAATASSCSPVLEVACDEHAPPCSCSVSLVCLLQVLPVNDTCVYNMWWDSYPYSSLSVHALHPQDVALRAMLDDLPGEAMPADIAADIEAARVSSSCNLHSVLGPVAFLPSCCQRHLLGNLLMFQ